MTVLMVLEKITLNNSIKSSLEDFESSGALGLIKNEHASRMTHLKYHKDETLNVNRPSSTAKSYPYL